MDIKLLRSKNLLGLIADRHLPELAVAALSGSDDSEMMQMALCDKDDLDCITQAKNALFEREGVLNISLAESAVCYAKDVCKSIVAGEIDPIVGSANISRVSIPVRNAGSNLLDPFVYASSEIVDRPEDQDFFVNAIIEEAKIILAKS